MSTHEELLVENIVLRAKLAKMKALVRDESRHMVRWIDHSHLIDLEDIKKALAD